MKVSRKKSHWQSRGIVVSHYELVTELFANFNGTSLVNTCVYR
jgi:hypothetical protein